MLAHWGIGSVIDNGYQIYILLLFRVRENQKLISKYQL